VSDRCARCGPPLYDVIRRGSLGRSPGATDDRESPRPAHVDIERDDYAVGNWLRPGRKVSVPAGYLFIAAALVLLLVIGGYMVSYGRGKHDEQLAFAEHLDPELADVARVLPRDPLEVSASSVHHLRRRRRGNRSFQVEGATNQSNALSTAGTFGPSRRESSSA
jgi:hypothetical protein